MIEKDKFFFRIFCVLFWISCTWGFVSEELLPFLLPIGPKVHLFCDLCYVIIGFCLYKDRKDFYYGFLSFLIIAFISTIIVNKESFITLFNGLREFIGILFGFPIIKYFLTCYKGEYYVKMFDRQLYAFLIIQAVCVPIQFIRYGAGDYVGGSFGNWNSGPLSTTIYIVVFYFVNKNWDDSKSYLSNIKANLKYIILIFPSFLNETKISFIFLLIMFVLYNKIEVKSLLKIMLSVPLILILLLGAFIGYLKATDQEFDELTSSEFYENYLVGEDPEFALELAEMYFDEEYDDIDQWSADVPRFTKILSMPSALSDSKGGMLLGAGAGQFKGGTQIELTKFASGHKWFLNGTRPNVVFIVTQIGIIGYIWFILYMLRCLCFKNRRYARALNMKIYLLMVFILHQPYIDAIRIVQFAIIYILLSLLVSVKDCKMALAACDKNVR